VQSGWACHTGDVVVGDRPPRALAVRRDRRCREHRVADETLTKEFASTRSSRATQHRALRDDGIGLRPLGQAHVKGKTNAIEVFTLS